MPEITEPENDWSETKNRLKQKIGLDAEKGSLLSEGQTEEMIGKLEVKLGKTKDEIQQVISNL